MLHLFNTYFLQRTPLRNLRNSRGRNCVKSAWTVTLTSSSFPVDTWSPVRNAQNPWTSVPSAVPPSRRRSRPTMPKRQRTQHSKRDADAY